MAKGKTKRQLADEAWLRNQQLEMPVEASPSDPTHPHLAEVPDTCPNCQRLMTFQSGWALIFGDLLQCGYCAQVIEVPRDEYERFARRLHEHFARLNALPDKKRGGPRVRGAG